MLESGYEISVMKHTTRQPLETSRVGGLKETIRLRFLMPTQITGDLTVLSRLLCIIKEQTKDWYP